MTVLKTLSAAIAIGTGGTISVSEGTIIATGRGRFVFIGQVDAQQRGGTKDTLQPRRGGGHGRATLEHPSPKFF